jgi:hypothetical protein
MAADRRSTGDIRKELATEREELVDALADLREDVNSARRIPMIAGAALLAGVAAFAAAKFVRGLGDDD